MKKLCIAALVLLFTTVFILSAGCVSLGSSTTDILMGNEKIGTITLTPAQHAGSIGNTPLDRFDITVELFGLKYTKGGLSKAETLVSLANLTHEGITIAGLEDALSDFTWIGADIQNSGDTGGASSESLLDTLLHIPLSASLPVEFGDVVNISDAGDVLNEAMDKLEDLLNSIPLFASSKS